MNKIIAYRQFKDNVSSRAEAYITQGGNLDTARYREDWGVYIDALCKAGVITPAQYDTWEPPPARVVQAYGRPKLEIVVRRATMRRRRTGDIAAKEQHP